MITTPVSPATTLHQAQTIISAALARSRKAGFAPMGIAILDDGRQPEGLCSRGRRIDVPLRRAQAGRHRRQLQVRARHARAAREGQPQFRRPCRIGRWQIPAPARCRIRTPAGRVLGAAGASAQGDEDEQICIAGIEAAWSKHAGPGSSVRPGLGTEREPDHCGATDSRVDQPACSPRSARFFTHRCRRTTAGWWC